MSRKINIDTDWIINDKIFNTVVSVFGQPSIDLFVSRLNYKIDRYIAWKPDPLAIASS